MSSPLSRSPDNRTADETDWSRLGLAEALAELGAEGSALLDSTGLGDDEIREPPGCRRSSSRRSTPLSRRRRAK